MGIIKAIKSWFGFVETDSKMGDIDLEVKEPSKEIPNEEQKNLHNFIEGLPTLDKFNAEFHNPRLNCLACQQTIIEGKIRFFKAPGDTIEQPFHKRCFKKMQRGILPSEESK